jgi:hypothetical protein
MQESIISSILDIQISKVSLCQYKGQRYHMPEFQHGNPVGLKEVFNHAHSSLRNVIERCFVILKNKWRILGHLSSYPV